MVLIVNLHMFFTAITHEAHSLKKIKIRRAKDDRKKTESFINYYSQTGAIHCNLIPSHNVLPPSSTPNTQKINPF